MNDNVWDRRLVKNICDAIYGKTISKVAWGNWQDWVDQPRRSTSIHIDKVSLLMAIARIRKTDRHSELTYKQIENKVSQEDLELLSGFKLAITQGRFVIGSEVLKELRSEGIQVSRDILLKIIPKFDWGAWYDILFIKSKIKELQASCN